MVLVDSFTVFAEVELQSAVIDVGAASLLGAHVHDTQSTVVLWSGSSQWHGGDRSSAQLFTGLQQFTGAGGCITLAFSCLCLAWSDLLHMKHQVCQIICLCSLKCLFAVNFIDIR